MNLLSYFSRKDDKAHDGPPNPQGEERKRESNVEPSGVTSRDVGSTSGSGSPPTPPPGEKTEIAVAAPSPHARPELLTPIPRENDSPAQPMAVPSALRDGATGFHFNAAKVEGKGEDADPVATWQENRGVLAVFDGMGGAGSTMYEHRGTLHTGAYIASRLAASEIERLFAPAFPLPLVPLDEKGLQERLSRALQKEAAFLESGAEPSRLKSKLIRRLPTTMAALCLERPESDSATVKCQAIWAGDSRCYALSPSRGLQQLTTDDLKTGGDALENLKGDSPLSNCLNADGDFVLHSQIWTFSLPVMLISATDGCFGYLFSPAHFEFLLLDALLSAGNVSQWQETVIARLRDSAGDDCSMALLALGWPSLSEMQQGFRERHRFLRDTYIVPLDTLSQSIQQDAAVLQETASRKADAEERRNALRQELWLRYKADHDRLLSETPKGVPAKSASRGAVSPPPNAAPKAAEPQDGPKEMIR